MLNTSQHTVLKSVTLINLFIVTPRPTLNLRGSIIGTWHRMINNTNDDDMLRISIEEKIEELKLLSYPSKHIKKTLCYMHNKTQKQTWADAMKGMH